ncbi:MAG TPA: glycosyltransferase, partial [Flavisolibacter sp.]|nr:glycosyltransferase [Flavisolibacter sp.]
RVHPKKGLTNLIEAIAILKEKKAVGLEDWTLVIAGCLEKGKYENELAALISKNNLEGSVLLLGQFYHEEKQACYYHANAFILPSFSEGMPLAALDAWAFGKYSILTPECNLPDGYEEGITKRIEANPDSIAQGLRELFLMPESELSELGNRARDYVSKEYSWTNIAAKMVEMYNWVSGSAPAPASINFS